ncbi:MAG TPA: SEC-C metal-binding domain-containing protein [Spirochaetota bacterium]|nr:SEC-C metal-binding domain-containing protein [Spirochaetota bacterium]
MSAIHRNGLCPCGSGKKYKKCCGASPIVSSVAPVKTYVNDSHRWMDENVLHGRYPDLHGFLVLVDHDIPADEIWDQLAYWSRRYLECSVDRSRHFHEIIDEMIERQMRLDIDEGFAPAFCHKGCSRCCYQPVACTDDEARLISEFCLDRGIAIDYDRILRQSSHIIFDNDDNFTGETTWDDQPASDRGCVFLDEKDGSCTIWEVRPFVCRVHLAAETDTYCGTNNGAVDSRAEGIHYSDCSYLLSAVFSIHHDSIGRMMNRLLSDIRHR